MKPALTALLGLVLFCMAGAAQSPAVSSNPWGEAIEGVQLGLTIAPNLATPQVPAFEVRLRNRGTSAVTFVSEALSSRAEIEIDGVWYRTAGGGSCCTSPQTVAAGADSHPLRVTIENRLMFQANSNQQFKLTPGKHSIRLRTYSASRINITVQTAAPHQIVLTSNTVNF